MSIPVEKQLKKANKKINRLEWSKQELETEVKTLRAIKRRRKIYEDEAETEDRLIGLDYAALSALQRMAKETSSVSSIPTADLIQMWKDALSEAGRKLTRQHNKNFNLEQKIKKLKAENHRLQFRLKEKNKTVLPPRPAKDVPTPKPDDNEMERLILVIILNAELFVDEAVWMMFDEAVFNTMMDELISIKHADKYPDAPRTTDGKYIEHDIMLRELMDHPWTSDYADEHEDITHIAGGGFYKLRRFIRKREQSVFPNLTFEQQHAYFKQIKEKGTILYGQLLPLAKYAGTQPMCEHIPIDTTKQIIVDVYIKQEGGNTDYK